MSSYVFRCPGTIHFGAGAAEKIGPEALRLGIKKPLIVTDSFLADSGSIDGVKKSLRDAGLNFEIYPGVNQEPTLSHINECMEILNKCQCDTLIGCGGGSPIDVAKAIAILATNKGKIQDYMGLNKVPKEGLPIIAIPTTAGTGSEATAVTIITDTERDIKMLIISDHLMPKIAIVDPELTLGMPKSLTAATGLDALTHAIEAYVSQKAQPMTDILALEAIQLIYKNLPLAWSEPSNLEARTKTMLGALEAGMAFSNSSVALVHGMSRPVGALFHIPHGVSNAALLGEVMEFSLSGDYNRYAKVAHAMGITDSGDQKRDAEAGAEKVKEIINKLEIPTLTKLGVSKEKLDPVVQKMAQDAIASGSPGNNPRLASENEIMELYYKSL